MNKKKLQLIGVIGDLHLSPSLGYADYIKDGRKEEKQEILDFIVSSFDKCSSIVLLGDLLNSITNSPQVLRELTNFIERFTKKNIYIIAGNHEKKSSGDTALDYLSEIKNPLWHIITKDATKLQIGAISTTFLPFLTKPELEAKDNEEALVKIMEKLEPADILFHHNTMSYNGKIVGLPLDINLLPEPILPIDKLLKKYKLVIGGHVHNSTIIKENAIVSGSIFNNSINEKQKYIWKISEDTLAVEQIKLPGRAIYGITDPKNDDIINIPTNSIVKITLTKKRTVDEIEELKAKLKRFDAFILIERIPKVKKKMHYGKGEAIMNFDVNELLRLYGEEKKVDIDLLNHGFELINN